MLFKYLISAILLTGFSLAIAQSPSSQKIQFDYELRLKVDFKQREAFLKKNGEEPASYEKALKFISGSVHAANITDVLTYKEGNKYLINSTGTLTSALSVALQDQKLLRASYGNVSKEGLSTLNYVEKRGNTERLEAKLDAKNNKVVFYKENAIVDSAAIVGNLSDMLNVMYMYVGRKMPSNQMSFNVTDARSLKQYRLNKAELWDFPFNGTKVKAYRYFKTVTKDDNTTLEIWFSEKDNIPLRMVVGLGERYGATIQADLKTIPTL